MTDRVADKTGRLQPGKCHVHNMLYVYVADGGRKSEKYCIVVLMPKLNGL